MENAASIPRMLINFWKWRVRSTRQSFVLTTSKHLRSINCYCLFFFFYHSYSSLSILQTRATIFGVVHSTITHHLTLFAVSGFSSWLNPRLWAALIWENYRLSGLEGLYILCNSLRQLFQPGPYSLITAPQPLPPNCLPPSWILRNSPTASRALPRLTLIEAAV